MVENGEQDNQEMSHVIRHYCKVSDNRLCAGALGGHMRAHAMGDVSNEPPHGDENLRIRHEGNRHSYFLRAKTPRFMGYQVSGEDGELKKSSSSSFGKFGLDKERESPLLSSPTPSPGSKSEHCDEYSASSEEEDLANCLAKEVVEKGMFQCKACKKVFNSHQALGGHRASHKKVKGCFAAKLDDEDNVDEDSIQEEHEPWTPSESDATRPMSTASTRKRPKMHECSVCRRVFTSGQALGGHKRCHWLTTSTDNAFIPNFHDFQYDHQSQQLCKKPMFTNPHHDHYHQLDLNLNLPAPRLENHAGGEDDNTSRYEASTRLYLQQLAASANHNQQKIESTVTTDNGEKGCEMKLRKLSDLRDMNLDGGWLQVGIASTTDIY
ncbi:hypothetical protein Pfo_025616 [Paulownia fortunei]|nr:hypothetical protein Pfo_025616 [Paulownia fortunei]